jgi:hypothetical protein
LANSGLHYPSAPGSLGQQTVVAELEKTLKEYRDVEQKHRGFSSLRDSEVLRTLVFLVRMAHARTSGRPRSRALVDSLFAQFPEKETLIETPDSAPSRIIAP